MKFRLLLFFLFIGTFTLFSQRRNSRQEVEHTVSNKDVVQSVFPTAVEVKKVNSYWYQILNEKGKVLGYAMNSTEHCTNIIGYSKQTPVMIITDKNGIILKVALLTHWETPSYIKILDNNGFFNLWNGKKFRDAQKVRIDGYTGATITAVAVEKNLRFLLEKGLEIKPTSK